MIIRSSFHHVFCREKIWKIDEMLVGTVEFLYVSFRLSSSKYEKAVWVQANMKRMLLLQSNVTSNVSRNVRNTQLRTFLLGMPTPPPAPHGFLKMDSPAATSFLLLTGTVSACASAG
jgi:hypothetical protein